MRAKDAVGRFGEQVAAAYLTEAGWDILARNWRSTSRESGGEIDIVARDGATLVFVEVKARTSMAFGTPAEAVDHRKAARIRRLAVQWMAEHRKSAGTTFWTTVRFDVVCVLGSGPDARIDHLVGSF